MNILSPNQTLQAKRRAHAGCNRTPQPPLASAWRYLGKPNPFMFVMARKRLGLRTGETVMIGDTMETDIRGAVELGIPAYLGLTGSTKREDVAAYPYQPTGILNSIADLLDLEETASATAEPTAGPAMPMD